MLAGTPREQTPAQLEIALNHYEGLIFSTAQRLVKQGVEQELEDIRQLLRIRVWKAIVKFDPSRGKPRDAYVFMVVFDGAKDIAKKKRRGELHIEDVAPAHLGNEAMSNNGAGGGPRDKFEERYLSTDHGDVYGEVDEGELVLPDTLTDRELTVLELMRQHYKQTEIAGVLDITKREVESAVRGIRTKLADWRPAVAA